MHLSRPTSAHAPDPLLASCIAALTVLALTVPDGSLSICISDAGEDAPLEVALLGQWLQATDGRVVASGYCPLSGDSAEEVLYLVCCLGSACRDKDQATAGPRDPLRQIADVLIEHLGERLSPLSEGRVAL